MAGVLGFNPIVEGTREAEAEEIELDEGVDDSKIMFSIKYNYLYYYYIFIIIYLQ
jgi:hypothetical protein